MARSAKTKTEQLLERYHAKRDFTKTAEPKGGRKHANDGALTYMIQKHDATRLHYDFRLELDGVLKSWAVTRGPSLNPEDKRLAVETEDHPMEYATFEGTIPEHEYGGGTVMLWDRGTWEPMGDATKDYAKGRMHFRLHGERLQGEWHLVKMQGHRKGDTKRNNWLLIKSNDDEADYKNGDRLLKKETTSIASGKGMEAIAKTGPVYGEEKATVSVTPMPKKFAPQLATLVTAPPRGDDWLHEIKFDGYRLIARITKGKAQLITRNGHDWTDKFPRIAKALKTLKTEHAILDGEVVALNDAGDMSFSALQRMLKIGNDAELRYYLFDLMHLDGEDIASLPLKERKQRLAALLPKKNDTLFYSDEFAEPGKDVLEQACRIGMEGIISKRANAPYRQGRGLDWVKSKCLNEQEFVIGGYTLQPKHANVLGALLLGYYEGKTLKFAGKCGTGFTQDEARALVKQLSKRHTKQSAFDSVPSLSKRGAVWVKPELVGQVRFTEWTDDLHLRHPSFQGLREDKRATAVVREKEKAPPTKAETKAVSAPELKEGEVEIIISSANRVVYEPEGITKGDVALYYQRVAPLILPHIINRPISLLRCPDGVSNGKCFFQRHAGQFNSHYLHDVSVANHGDDEPYVFIRDEAGLLSLVQMGVLEIHAWGATATAPELADRITFDFDPEESVAWDKVKQAALTMREMLKQIGLESFLKSTGGKGLHVVAPITPGPDWDHVKSFTHALAGLLAESEPDAYTTNIRKAARKGRIFIDYLRNDSTATAIAPYSLRARAGAPIAIPMAWEDLPRMKQGALVTMENVEQYLKRHKTDPWKQFYALHQRLPKL